MVFLCISPQLGPLYSAQFSQALSGFPILRRLKLFAGSLFTSDQCFGPPMMGLEE